MKKFSNLNRMRSAKLQYLRGQNQKDNEHEVFITSASHTMHLNFDVVYSQIVHLMNTLMVLATLSCRAILSL